MDKALGSNPYDVSDATVARKRHDSYRSDGFGLITQTPQATSLSPVDKIAHSHRNKFGRFCAEHDCTVCQKQSSGPPFSVPTGFSVLRTDQGGWMITPLPLPLMPRVAEESVVNAETPLQPIAEGPHEQSGGEQHAKPRNE